MNVFRQFRGRTVRAFGQSRQDLHVRVSTVALIAASVCLAGTATTVRAAAPDADSASSDQPIQVAQAAQTAQAAPSQQLEEVVVTARLRAEKLQDVPAAVTAFTEQEIENAGIVSPRDFIQLTPNVTLVETQNIGTSFVIIRGISQARNSEPSVATVVDGVQQVNPSQFDQSLFDIQQIEVLKGPQGGLYGRNAIGGAILINTRQPTDQYEYEFKAGVDNGPGVTVLGTASGPVPGTDNLKFIGSLQYINTDGYINNPYLNTSADPFEDRDGRFKLLWTPLPNLTLDGRISFSQVRTTAYYYNIVSDVNDTSLPVEVNNKGEDDRDMFDASVKADYNFGFATATSVTAYDTLTEIDTGDAYNFLPIPQSFFKQLLGVDLNQSQYLNVEAVSEDLRLTSPADQRIRWIVGGYLIHTDRFISTGNMVDLGHGVYPVYRVPSTSPINPQATFLADSQDNFAWAGYGDLTGDITDQLELALSLRYDSDHRQNTTDTPTPFLPSAFGVSGGFTGEVRDKTFSAVQPKVTLRYKPEDDLTFYADWGRGFRSGGFNQTGVGLIAKASGILGVGDTFQAEVANTWEVFATSAWNVSPTPRMPLAFAIKPTPVWLKPPLRKPRPQSA